MNFLNCEMIRVRLTDNSDEDSGASSSLSYKETNSNTCDGTDSVVGPAEDFQSYLRESALQPVVQEHTPAHAQHVQTSVCV